jgi:hypothetical protein
MNKKLTHIHTFNHVQFQIIKKEQETLVTIESNLVY